MFWYFFYVCAFEIDPTSNREIVGERSYFCISEIEGASNLEIIGERSYLGALEVEGAQNLEIIGERSYLGALEIEVAINTFDSFWDRIKSSHKNNVKYSGRNRLPCGV